MVRIVLWLVFGVVVSTSARAQLSNPLSNRVVNYKTVFDDPYDLNQLWINLNPISVQAGSDNVSLGYGLQTRIMASKSLQFVGGFHTSYTPATDIMGNSARANAGIKVSPAPGRQEQTYRQLNTFNPFTTIELVAQYAVYDAEKKGSSVIMLTSQKSRVMEFTTADEIVVDSRRRRVVGVRLGLQTFSSTVSLNKPLEKQGLWLTAADGTRLTSDGRTITATGTSGPYRNQLYTSLRANTIAIGSSYQLIRNVAIKADKFGNLANNILFTTFADLLVAPDITLDDIRVGQPNGSAQTYSTQGVFVRNVGFRAGADVVYNQELHASFGGEVGVRPGLRGQGFYFAGRVSFPSLGFKLNRRRLANAAPAEQPARVLPGQ